MTTSATGTMPGLTRAETTIFFVSPTLIHMVKETLVKLGKEGINKAEDLAKFDQEIWKQVADNLEHPGV
eukprot:12564095-Ditylum_brightwellii.AAC.2